MTKASMVFLGLTVLGAGSALAYTLASRKRERVSERGSMPALLNAACLSAARGDVNGFYVSVQAAGTLLDGNAQPSLSSDAPNSLFSRYQVAVTAPDTLALCEGDNTLLGLANELASYGYDYEASQVLRIALTEVP